MDLTFGTELTARTVEAYFDKVEAQFSDITPGVQKRIIWNDAPRVKTSLSVLYLHGFSATSEEIRPVPDNVADALGANLVFTRLAGHGRGGAAMAEPDAGDWIEDTAEALAAARAVGNEVLVIATSTGGTLAALAALDGNLARNVKGIVFVSPNFKLKPLPAVMLNWPGARVWGPWIAGAERGFRAVNADHAKYWTSRYPTVSLIPMAALVAHAANQDYSRANIPAFFMFSESDTVVSAKKTKAVALAWGGPTRVAAQVLTEGDDPYGHVIAGDIVSPGMTETVSQQIIDWVRAL